MKRNPTPETRAIDAIKDTLKAARVFYVRMVGTPFFPKGISDLICCQPVKVKDLMKAGIEEIGVFVAIEVKPEGWKPPKHGTRAGEHYQAQTDWQEWVRNHKGVAFFATSPEEVVEKLGLFGRIMPLFSRRR